MKHILKLKQYSIIFRIKNMFIYKENPKFCWWITYPLSVYLFRKLNFLWIIIIWYVRVYFQCYVTHNINIYSTWTFKEVNRWKIVDFDHKINMMVHVHHLLYFITSYVLLKERNYFNRHFAMCQILLSYRLWKLECKIYYFQNHTGKGCLDTVSDIHFFFN